MGTCAPQRPSSNMRRDLCFPVLILALLVGFSQGYSAKIRRIIAQAQEDGIDLLSLPFANAAFQSIESISSANTSWPTLSNVTRVDNHAHFVPDFYRSLVPDTSGRATPEWDVATQFEFMVNSSIAHSVLSVSSPGSTVFLGNEAASVGLARLLNECLAEVSRKYPDRFSFMAVTPLPYVNASCVPLVSRNEELNLMESLFSIAEANYALSSLKAVGIGLLTNHEGLYLGNPALRPFFAALNSSDMGAAHSIFVHPTNPYLRVNGSFIEANPTLYSTGSIEYYFETARTVADLTVTQTLMNYTNLRWQFAQCGGSFPSVQDRLLKRSPALEASAQEVYNSRVWYDSAGPTYFAQVKGLLGYDVPTSQLLFGSDYPYREGTYEQSTAAVEEATFLTEAEKAAIFSENYAEFLGREL